MTICHLITPDYEYQYFLLYFNFYYFLKSLLCKLTLNSTKAKTKYAPNVIFFKYIISRLFLFFLKSSNEHSRLRIEKKN